MEAQMSACPGPLLAFTLQRAGRQENGGWDPGTALDTPHITCREGP